MTHVIRPGDKAMAAGYRIFHEPDGWGFERPPEFGRHSHTGYPTREGAGNGADSDYVDWRGSPQDAARKASMARQSARKGASRREMLESGAFVRDAAEVAFEASADTLARNAASALRRTRAAQAPTLASVAVMVGLTIGSGVVALFVASAVALAFLR